MLDALITAVDGKTRSFRAISHYIQSTEFMAIYRELTEIQRERVVLVILDGDFEKLKSTLKQFTDFKLHTLKELRNLGQRYGVAGYQSMDKVTLIRELSKCMTK